LETPAIAVGNIRKEIVRMSGFAKENLNYAMEMLLDENKDNTEIISEMIEYISGTKVKVYAIDILEARSLLMKYHNLLQVNKLPKLNPEESIYD
jgi:phosphate uptake regulator